MTNSQPMAFSYLNMNNKDQQLTRVCYTHHLINIVNTLLYETWLLENSSGVSICCAFQSLEGILMKTSNRRFGSGRRCPERICS